MTPTSTPAPQPAAPASQPQGTDARGKVSALRGDGISVTRENGSTLSCGFPAEQATSLAAAYPLGTGVRLVCSLDGTRYRLATIERA